MNSIPKTKRYIEMDIKEKIANDCGGTQLIDDVNHPVRRYFRCWLDGSYEYDGGITYRRNCDFILKHHDDHRIMRQFVVNQFATYTAHEYNCSVRYARECIVACIEKPNLEHLNELLIEDALDLVDIREEEQ
jgi:hypothetical protein